MVQEKGTFLREVLPFWKALTAEEQDQLMEATEEVHFEKGDIVHRGQADCTGLHLIHAGQMRVYFISDTGKEITLYRLFERDICIFSAACMMRNIRFEVWVEAESSCDTYLIPTPIYQRLNQNVIAVSDFTSQLMSSRFSDVMWVMEQVVFMSFDKRLAIFLLEQSAAEGSDTLHITQEVIARHLGSAREVVTRMLKYFQTEGMVEIFRGGVKLLDRKALERQSGE